jgi:hypothetical protein
MPDTDSIDIQKAELVPLEGLKNHPRNYRGHPEAQIQHLMHSIREFGFYRNIVVAKDLTILAGHGIAEASRRLEISEVPAVRLPIGPDHPLALKLLAADNYLSYFAEDDDRMLTEMLRDLATTDIGLFGTGFDEAQLAALAMVTRPASEIVDFDAAAEWIGMPDYEPADRRPKVILIYDSEEDRDDLIEKLGLVVSSKLRTTWSAPWPPRISDDVASLLVEG